MNLKIGPTKWTFDTNPGSIGHADVKENREGVMAVGCRILQSGQALDLEAQIYLNGDQLVVMDSPKLLTHTISFPELEGEQYFVRSNRWNATIIERYGGTRNSSKRQDSRRRSVQFERISKVGWK